MGVPGAARASVAGSALVSVNASVLSLKPGAGLTSQRTPYVRVMRDAGDHVSCAYDEKLVECEDRLCVDDVARRRDEAVPPSAPATPVKVHA
jgi:hypothetical protein